MFTEGGRRRYRQGATEAKLAAKLAAVTERLEADAPDMERPGADLIACGSTPPRSPPTATSASSAGRWPQGGTGTAMS